MRTFSFPLAGLCRPALALALAAAVALVAAIASTSAHATAPGRNGPIAFHRFYGRSGVTAGIFVINPDGTGERQLTHPAFRTNDEAPDFAPDGSNVIFSRHERRNRDTIQRVSLNGGAVHRLDPACPAGGCQHEGAYDATYSPDGKQIAFVRIWGPTPRGGHGPPKFNAIYVMSARGTHLRKVVSERSLSAFVASPGWSPDGKQIAFARAPFRSGSGDLTPRSSAIYVVRASGKGIRRITQPSLNGGDRPDFSPDGTLILFHSLPKSGELGGQYYTVHPDGSGLTQLTHLGPTAELARGCFSPDGQSVVLAYAPDRGNPDLYTMHLDGSALTQVTHTQAWDSSVDWGPAR